MTAKRVSFAQLTHDVVRDSPEPLPTTEILVRVDAIRPVTTKNPEGTIRGAISQSRMILSTGDGRFGWTPRLVNGSFLRHTLQNNELAYQELYWDEDLLDALWPTRLAAQKDQDLSPAQVTLSDGAQVEFTLGTYRGSVGVSEATPQFWYWLATLNPNPDDHLLLEVVDGEARSYKITFQRRAERDEAAIAARDLALMEISSKLLQRPWSAAPWEVTGHLLATGFYRHPIPPDPFSELWLGLLEPVEADDEGLPGILAGAVATGADDPLDLPLAYDPRGGNRRARKSLKALTGPVTSYIFRVSHRAVPAVWRDVELAEDNTLEDLHLVIQAAYGWGDDHLYSFFLSGDSRDRRSEIGSPWSESAVHTHQVQIGQLDFRKDQKFLYFFDYGDSHEFDVRVRAINSSAPQGVYPRIVNYHGPSPPQYPEFDPETGEWSWDADEGYR